VYEDQPLHAMKPPLEFYVMARTYNTYGGHQTLSLIPGFILTDAPMFGTAVNELTVTFHFSHRGPPRSSLEQLFADFHANRRKLPKVVFRRSRQKAAVDVASDLVDGKDWETHRAIPASLFRSGFAEAVAALALLKTRLTTKDDFSLDALLDHCRQREASLPDSDDALSTLKQELDERKKTIRDAMSPWDRLGLDWRDFHSDARRILDDPFYWEQANDFSPHGNDTGADLLSEYRRWLKRYPSADPQQFYQGLMERWDFSGGATDPMIQSAMDEAAVALAFAELKLRGNCRPSAAALAKAAILRQRQAATLATDWPHREDRLRSLELIEAKLQTGG
jgi:uncharacterized protein YfeS